MISRHDIISTISSVVQQNSFLLWCITHPIDERPRRQCVWWCRIWRRLFSCCVRAWFMISSSSFFERALNFYYWFWPNNLLNKFISPWSEHINFLCHMPHTPPDPTYGQKGACASDPCCSWCIATNIPVCLSMIKLISGRVSTIIGILHGYHWRHPFRDLEQGCENSLVRRWR
jgi:hypothetical protein